MPLYDIRETIVVVFVCVYMYTHVYPCRLIYFGETVDDSFTVARTQSSMITVLLARSSDFRKASQLNAATRPYATSGETERFSSITFFGAGLERRDWPTNVT